MMKRALVVFISGCIGFYAVFAVGAFALQEQLGPLAGLVFLPVLAVPFIMAYVAHRMSGAIGNPFRGLVWGNTSMYFIVWIAATLAGLLTALISIGIGTSVFDPEMGGYIQMSIEAAERQGNSIPEGQTGVFKIVGYSTAAIAPTIGAVLGGALICLTFFPMFGWFGRRMLVQGRGAAIGSLVALFLVTGALAGLVPTEQYGETTTGLRCVLLGIGSAVLVPGLFWLFLKTRSAVLPSFAQGSFQGGLGALIPFIAGGDPLYAPPLGITVIVVAAAFSLALWVWKDPGGNDLAVAAVAHDGTPLTPERLEALEAAGIGPLGVHTWQTANAGNLQPHGVKVPLLDEIEGIPPPPGGEETSDQTGSNPPG